MSDMDAWARPVPGTGRVLFPAVPLPGQSLMGLVFETAADNVHGNVGAILAAAGYPHHGVCNLAETFPEKIGDLARVLGVDPALLAPMRHEEVLRGRTSSIVTFLGTIVPRYDVVTMERRVSGRTVGSEPWHHAIWNHRLLPYCPKGLDLVHRSCPVCRLRLGWYHAEGVHACGRPGCTADLRDHPAAELPAELVEPYRRMASLIGACAPGERSAELHGDLAALEGGAALELGWRLACILERDGAGLARRDSHQRPPEVVASLLARADSILAGWPLSLDDELRAIHAADGHAGLAAARRIRAISNESSGWPTLAALLRRAHPALTASDRAAMRWLATDAVDGTTAQHLIGVTSNRFAAIKRAGGLPAIARSGSKRTFDDFALETVRALQVAAAGSQPANKFSERWGLTAHGVEQLVCLRLLDAELHPALQIPRPGLRIRKMSSAALIASLQERASSQLEEPVAVRAVFKGVGGEKPWGPLIAAMFGGDIPFALADGSGKLFRRLQVDAADMEAVTSLRFRREDHPGFSFACDMTKRDAEEALNLSPQYLPTALLAELGAKTAVLRRVAVADVNAIVDRRISAAEIAARWQAGSRRLPHPLRGGRGPRRINIVGWDRSTVEALLQARPPP